MEGRVDICVQPVRTRPTYAGHGAGGWGIGKGTEAGAHRSFIQVKGRKILGIFGSNHDEGRD